MRNVLTDQIGCEEEIWFGALMIDRFKNLQWSGH